MHLLNRDEALEKIAALEAASALGKILSHKWHSHIAGGLADKRSPADFPREDLIKGMVVEMEHTSDPSIACEIAMDHLMEDEHYYNHEQDMAKEVREKLGHVMVQEDASIKMAQAIGASLAGMTKEAIPNPISAVRNLGSKIIGRVAPKALGSVAHGVEGAAVHGAEGAMGKVLPFRGTVTPRPAQSISGLEHTVLDAHPAGALAPSVGTVRPGMNQGARPVGRVEPQVPVQQAVQNAVGQPERMGTAVHEANKAKVMATPAGREGADALIRDPKRLAEFQASHGIPAQAPRSGPVSSGSFGGNAGFKNSPGSVVARKSGGGPTNSGGGPDVHRFGTIKALGAAGLLGAGYAAYKGVPWAVNKMDESNSTPKAFGDYYRSTPYGYGPNPYGDGSPTMGAG